MKLLFLIVAMIFFHIIDDYYLQGWLASAKQIDWWKKNAPDPMYKNDYIMALLEHAFSWTCMIYIPLIIYTYMYWDIELMWVPLFFSFVENWAVHATIDNLKANRKCINLIQDQLLHFVQIILTCFYLNTVASGF